MMQNHRMKPISPWFSVIYIIIPLTSIIVLWDIPVNANELVSGAGNTKLNLLPEGVIQSITDYGANGYGGPCPPEGHGLHQYIITVYALKTDKLGLDGNTNPAVVGYYLWNNTLTKASIVTYYKRSKK